MIRHGHKALSLDDLPRRRSLARTIVTNLIRFMVHTARHHPWATAQAVIAATAALVFGARTVMVALLALAVGVVLAAVFWPAARAVMKGRARGFWHYRHGWEDACEAVGLVYRSDTATWVPRVRKVRSDAWRDRLLLDLAPGQEPEDFQATCGRLAHYFGARDARVRVDRPGRIWLDLATHDPLTDSIPALPIAAPPDLSALPVGKCDDGSPWTLGILGRHTLIAGASGAGKGSVLWSSVRALLPALRGGSVAIWAIDPKGGMELTIGGPLWTRYEFADTEAMVSLLEDAVAVMKERAEDLRCSGRRAHEPTSDEPLIVVLVDEMADLIAYGGTRDQRKRAVAAMQLLLTQGRAPGVVVIAAVQDPSKEIVPFRDLFTARIALRLLERTQVAMVLGDTARERGARCDDIPFDMPGTGYVTLDGVREPARVRAAYVSDDDIRAMVADLQDSDGHVATPLPAPDNQPHLGVRGRVKGGSETHHEVTRSALDAAPSPEHSPIGGREPHGKQEADTKEAP